MAQICFAWSLWNDCGAQPEPQADLWLHLIDRELLVHNGSIISVNPTGSGLHRRNDKEKSNLVLMHRCPCFQVSEWSPRSKCKRRDEGGGELLLWEPFFLCLCPWTVYVCPSSSSTHCRASLSSRNSPWLKSLLCVDKRPKSVRWRQN